MEIQYFKDDIIKYQRSGDGDEGPCSGSPPETLHQLQHSPTQKSKMDSWSNLSGNDFLTMLIGLGIGRVRPS